MDIHWVSNVILWVKLLVAKQRAPNSIFKTHIAEGENWLLYLFFGLYTCVDIPPYQQTEKWQNENKASFLKF